MVLRLAALVAVAGGLLWSGEARACPVCSSGDPAATVVGPERSFVDRVRISAELRRSTVRVGEPGLDEVSVTEQQLALGVAYAPAARLYVSASVPLFYRTTQWADGREATAFGPGDAEVRVKGELSSLRSTRTLTWLQAGLKLPTAPVQTDDGDEPLRADLQPGGGAFGPFAGLSSVVFGSGWLFNAGVTLYLPHLEVRERPHPPTPLLRSVTYLQLAVHPRLATRFGFNSRLDLPADTYGSVDPDSGGFVGFVTTECILPASESLSVTVGGHFPVVQLLFGEHRLAPIWALGATYEL